MICEPSWDLNSDPNPKPLLDTRHYRNSRSWKGGQHEDTKAAQADSENSSLKLYSVFTALMRARGSASRTPGLSPSSTGNT